MRGLLCPLLLVVGVLDDRRQPAVGMRRWHGRSFLRGYGLEFHYSMPSGRIRVFHGHLCLGSCPPDIGKAL